MAHALPNKCPVCRKPPLLAYQPFCSTRCANVDLGRWLGETYKLPTDEGPPDGGFPGHEEDEI